MKEEDQNKNNNRKNFSKMWVAIIIAIIFLLIGFYLYYFYPKLIPGMASINENIIEENERPGEIAGEETKEVVKEETKTLPNLIKEDANSTEEVIKEETERITEILKKDTKREDTTSSDKSVKEEDKALISGIKEGITNLAQTIKEGVSNIVNPDLKEDVNILIIGLDDLESVTRGEIAADALVLAKLHPEDKKLDLINIITKDKVLNLDMNNKEEELIDLLDKMGKITSTEIDYYFTISYQGFTNLVDNLDGIEIALKEDLKVPGLNLDLKAGRNTLSGAEALSYSRWLDYTKDERDRIRRQQQIISAMIKKAFFDKSIFDLPQLFKTTVDTFKMVNTNIEYNMITKIIAFFNNATELEINYNIISDRKK
ncbi:MAG: polyisoprenyl-teichoic acid--peptidoglycan teichoic acid transferase [Halanaerobiales bacterium]|nr:polyisoprenyl-teichoic acid--peptidoglycan teichoic acid transferase [Halanaerobiales bacterium]